MDAHNGVKLYKSNEKNEQEAREVSAFLENSYHFKEMKRIASKQGMRGAVDVVADIEKHLTFYLDLYLSSIPKKLIIQREGWRNRNWTG